MANEESKPVEIRRRSLAEQCAWWSEQLEEVAQYSELRGNSQWRPVVSGAGMFLDQLEDALQGLEGRLEDLRGDVWQASQLLGGVE